VLDPVEAPAQAEAVYRALLEHPAWDVADLIGHLGIPETDVHDALSTLADRALVQPSASQPGALRAISPRLGLLALLDRIQEQMAAQQFEIQVVRAMITTRPSTRDALPESAQIVRLQGADHIRDRLDEFARTATRTCRMITAGRGMRPEMINHMCYR